MPFVILAGDPTVARGAIVQLRNVSRERVNAALKELRSSTAGVEYAHDWQSSTVTIVAAGPKTVREVLNRFWPLVGIHVRTVDFARAERLDPHS